VFLPTTPSMTNSLILAAVTRQAAERLLAVNVSETSAGIYVVGSSDDDPS
jgi:hypothetical protein